MNKGKKHILKRITISESGCWIWSGAVDSHGYGKCCFVWDGKRITVSHRLAYMAFVGEIPEGMQVDHMCWQPQCCNPSHLRLLSALENVSRQRSAMKPFCKHGHPLSGGNVYIRTARSGGQRQCRLCNLRAVKQYRARLMVVKIEAA